MKLGTVFITVSEQVFHINASNKGAMSFEILDSNPESDEELPEIWINHASKT